MIPATHSFAYRRAFILKLAYILSAEPKVKVGQVQDDQTTGAFTVCIISICQIIPQSEEHCVVMATTNDTTISATNTSPKPSLGQT